MLIFGGVTREGNRRARRAARAAVADGVSVVWFDGYEESEADDGRVALDGADPGAPVLVVGYASLERAHPLLRMLELPDGLGRPYLKEGSTHDFADRVRRLLSRIALAIRTRVLRRISLVFRGVIGWHMVKSDVEGLAAAPPMPVQIIFGDDFSQTQAWHAARIWAEVPTGMEFIQK